MAEFDYMIEAGLYTGKTLRSSRGPRYKRFETAAEAVRFAMEDLPGPQLRGCVLEVNEARFDEKRDPHALRCARLSAFAQREVTGARGYFHRGHVSPWSVPRHENREAG